MLLWSILTERAGTGKSWQLCNGSGTINVTMETVYLGLGSNLGDREANLGTALAALSCRIMIDKVSPVYETEPVGYADQPWFLNLVCCGQTIMEPYDLLAFVKMIERQMGREENFPNGPRPIDIDILFFGNWLVTADELVIPHPRIAERGFVLVPLARIAPKLVHPKSGKTIKDLLSELKDPAQVKEWGNVSSIGQAAF